MHFVSQPCIFGAIYIQCITSFGGKLQILLLHASGYIEYTEKDDIINVT